MHTRDEPLWYDSRELIEADDWDPSDKNDECIRTLLEYNLQKLSLQAIGAHSQAYDSSILIKIFKPNNNNNNENLPIFNQNETTVRTNMFAKSILRLRLKLQHLMQELRNLEDKISHLSGNPSQDSDKKITKISSKDEKKSASLGNSIVKLNSCWPPGISKLFWFAWPILLLTVLNKYWSPIRTKRAD